MSDNTNRVTVQFIGDASSLERSVRQVQNSLNGMHTSVGKSMFKAMAGFELLKQGLRLVGTTLKDGTGDAIKYEAIMDTLGQRLGKSADDFTKWSDTTGKAMGFSKLQSAEMANTLSVTLSQIATSQADLTSKTTTLMEASAVIRSKTGRTMQDVSERIRSAMNQEADGADELGLNVRTNAISMSDAFKKMSDGQAWKDLNTHQQKAILYQYILDQTAQNFGTTMSENTSLKMAQFTASLGDMKLALGQAFLPIVNTVLPLLNGLVQWITTALGYVQVFMEALFGYKHDNGASVNAQTNAMQGFAGAVGDATDAQDGLNASKAKGAKANEKKVGGLSSFDEIHTLPKQEASSKASSGSGGSGGGGGLGLGGIQNTPVDPTAGLAEKLTEAQQKVADFAGKVKAFFQPVIDICMFVWDTVSTYVKGAFAGINEWWAENGEYIGKGFKNLWDNFLAPVFGFIIDMIWGNIKGAIDGLITFFEGLIQFVGGIFSGEWGKAFEGLWMMVKGAFEFIWNFIQLVFVVNIFGAIKGCLGSIGAKFLELFSLSGEKSIVGMVGKGLNGIKTFFAEIIPKAWQVIVDVFKGVGSWLKTNLSQPFSDILGSILNFFKTKPAEWWNSLKGAFGGVKEWFLQHVIDPITSAFSNIGEGMKGVFDKIVGGFKKILNWTVRPIINTALDGVNMIPGINIAWRMPELYNGGITNGKTIAQIGDNVGGQEVVSPLSTLNSIISKTMADTMNWNGGGNGGGGAEIVLKVGSTEFGRVAVDSINKLTKQEGRLALNI